MLAVSAWCQMQANSMAYGRKLSVNPNICALCNKMLEDMSHVGGDAPEEETIQLPCKHLFHSLCLRGWTMVGKKDTCPTCLEKTDLRMLYSDRPWEARNLQWNGMLDFVRYMVVWFPIICTGMWVMLHLMHIDTNGQPNAHVMPPSHKEVLNRTG
jgi:RING finger protein 121/175